MEEFEKVLAEIDMEIAKFCKAMDELHYDITKRTKASKKLEAKYNKLIEVSVI